MPCLRSGLLLAFTLLCGVSFAQIGGQTAEDGPFLLDDAEDLNLGVESLGRVWISDFVQPQGDVLSVLSLESSDLITTTTQSGTGALRVTLPALGGQQKYIEGGFGVPVPSVKGASTLDFPGDITSFESWELLVCHEPAVPEVQPFILMECYPQNPNGKYPQLQWTFASLEGNEFGRVLVDLRTPHLVANNPQEHSVEDLLSNARFMSFYFFGSVPNNVNEVLIHLDDIRLVGTAPPPPTLDRLLDYLLGVVSDSQGLDVNLDGEVDAGDLLQFMAVSQSDEQ